MLLNYQSSSNTIYYLNSCFQTLCHAIVRSFNVGIINVSQNFFTVMVQMIVGISLTNLLPAVRITHILSLQTITLIECYTRVSVFSDYRSCEENEFTCNGASVPSVHQCISREYQCDGISHCADHSDESPELCSHDTRGDQFLCDNGQVIPWTYVCDNRTHDCNDYSDERYCGEF